jgi:Fe-S-cluster containining protein
VLLNKDKRIKPQVTEPSELPFYWNKQGNSLAKFRKFLRSINLSSNEIDSFVFSITDAITPQIDCKKCANCCNHLQPELHSSEIKKLSCAKGVDEALFSKTYLAPIEAVSDGYFLKKTPCEFLCVKLCSIYESRPNSCKDFPNLKSPHFRFKLSIERNFKICPIVASVVLELQNQLGYLTDNNES